MIKFSKAIAANTDLLTAQIFIAQEGNLGLVTLVSGSGDDIFTTVRSAISELQTTFFEDPEIKTSDRVGQYFTLLSEKLSGVEELQILTAAWKENPPPSTGAVLYIKSQGSHLAYLLRDKSLSNLATGESSQVVSGYLKPGDRLFFVTETFVSIEKDNLSKIASLPSDELEDRLEAFLHEHPDTDPIAASFVDCLTSKRTTADELEAIPPAGRQRIYDSLHTWGGAAYRGGWALFALLKEKKLLPEGKKPKVILGLVLFLFLFIGIALSLYSNKKNEKEGRFTQSLNEAKNKYAEALNLKDLDPKEAKESLDLAKAKLELALKIKPKDNDAQKLKQEIEQNSKEVLKVEEVKDLPLFSSLKLIKEGFSASRMSASAGVLLLLDEDKKTLITLDLETKRPDIQSGAAQLGDAKFASVNGGVAFVYSKDKGVVKVDTKTQKASVVAKPDPQWGNITDIYAFAGNFYLLDSIGNQVWKYVPIENGYSGKNPYIKSGKVDLAGAKRLQIDSSVWVLKGGPEVIKFTSGVVEGFSIFGLDKALQDSPSFFVSSDTENIYFLDKGNSRLVSFKKNGEYQAQYTGEKFKQITDFIVDEKSKKAFLLEGDKIYRLDLK